MDAYEEMCAFQNLIDSLLTHSRTHCLSNIESVPLQKSTSLCVRAHAARAKARRQANAHRYSEILPKSTL